MCRNKITGGHLIDHVGLMRQISSANLPERHVRVPKQCYTDFGDNYIFGELVVGELVCRRVVRLHSKMPVYADNFTARYPHSLDDDVIFCRHYCGSAQRSFDCWVSIVWFQVNSEWLCFDTVGWASGRQLTVHDYIFIAVFKQNPQCNKVCMCVCVTEVHIGLRAQYQAQLL